MRKRILALIFANILALGIILYFMDYLGISNIYSQLKSKIRVAPLTQIDTTTKALALLEKEEEKKLLASFAVRETELQKWEDSLRQSEEDLKAKELELKQERQNLKLRRKKLEAEKQKKESYDLKIENLAEKFFKMPPEKAVERMLALKDDLLILDILKALDDYASSTQRPSIVPYIFSLMPAEDSARLDKKYTLQ